MDIFNCNWPLVYSFCLERIASGMHQVADLIVRTGEWASVEVEVV
jgi:hypothetical protein